MFTDTEIATLLEAVEFLRLHKSEAEGEINTVISDRDLDSLEAKLRELDLDHRISEADFLQKAK